MAATLAVTSPGIIPSAVVTAYADEPDEAQGFKTGHLYEEVTKETGLHEDDKSCFEESDIYYLDEDDFERGGYFAPDGTDITKNGWYARTKEITSYDNGIYAEEGEQVIVGEALYDIGEVDNNLSTALEGNLNYIYIKPKTTGKTVQALLTAGKAEYSLVVDGKEGEEAEALTLDQGWYSVFRYSKVTDDLTGDTDLIVTVKDYESLSNDEKAVLSEKEITGNGTYVPSGIETALYGIDYQSDAGDWVLDYYIDGAWKTLTESESAYDLVYFEGGDGHAEGFYEGKIYFEPATLKTGHDSPKYYFSWDENKKMPQTEVVYFDGKYYADVTEWYVTSIELTGAKNQSSTSKTSTDGLNTGVTLKLFDGTVAEKVTDVTCAYTDENGTAAQITYINSDWEYAIVDSENPIVNYFDPINELKTLQDIIDAGLISSEDDLTINVTQVSGGDVGGSIAADTNTKTETAADGTVTETTTGTKTNASGNTVATTTKTVKDSTGAVTSVTEQSVIANAAANTSASVTVNKDGSGTVKSAAADIANTVSSGNKSSIDGAVVKQVTEAAGTSDVAVTLTVKDSDGSIKYTVKADAGDLTAENSLKVYSVDSTTGEYVMVNAKTYTVDANGSVSVSLADGNYVLVTKSEANAINKAIKATIKPAKTKATVKKDKNTTFKLSSKLNKSNIKKITYSTSKKSVAKVSKSGKITAKKKGTATIKAKVTLKNGTTKTVQMKIKVK
jgi:hypothetical protein